jgi:hypothetical protein
MEKKWPPTPFSLIRDVMEMGCAAGRIATPMATLLRWTRPELQFHRADLRADVREGEFEQRLKKREAESGECRRCR